MMRSTARGRGSLLTCTYVCTSCLVASISEMAELRLLFVGSGAVNFGGAEGPWDHSRRLEQLGGVKIVAIADPDLPKAQEVLKRKQNGAHGDLYRDCKVYADYKDALKAEKPDVAFIGVPPYCHGSVDPPLDIELQCLNAGVHLFVEKPVSVVPPEKFEPYAEAVEKVRKEKGLIVSVGYMFRYHPAIEQIQSVLKEYGRSVISINARYNCAYSELDHPFWWNKARSGGPIVEQATHFCDLLRFIGGEVKQETIHAIAVPASDDKVSPGYLSSVPAVNREAELPAEKRIPRLTSSNWCFTSGAIGALTHGATLQGKKYEASIDVWADGLRLALEEPYFPECKLRVRLGNTDEEKIYHFPTADPYLEEVKVFLATVRSGNPDLIRSPYADAAKTYKLSWDIRRASE